MVREWDVQTGKRLRTGECLHILAGHTDHVYCIEFNPDGRTVVTSSADQTLRTWDVQSGECLRVVHRDRPSERMNISGAGGLTTGPIISLKQLGAIT